MNLVIVESPTKSKTLQGFLGKNYLVKSSYGHIRDLPQKELGVDIEKNFRPKYVIPYKAKKRVTELKSYLSKATDTILATDEDREGESIAWHLAYVLGLKNPARIVFHEITKQAIEEALKNPRKIDMNLVDAQQARRILDRLVGYKISPLLWKKLMRGLSAGRVQSVAVRLVVEREKEIENFVPQEYWKIEAELQSRGTTRNPEAEQARYGAGKTLNHAEKEFLALLVKKDGKVIPKLGIKTKEEAEEIVKDLEDAQYKVTNIEKKEVKRNPLPPFTTSTLQQDAWSKLHFGAKKTMFVAQNLYERGLISYHRTDSLSLSAMSQQMAKKFIQGNYGNGYWPGFSRSFKTKSKAAQEAHEAIRPTYLAKTPDDLKLGAKLDSQQYRLYDLIWRRFIACQMTQARFDSTAIEIEAENSKFEIRCQSSGLPEGLHSKQIQKQPYGESRTSFGPAKLKTQNKYTFRTTGQILKFDGFLKVYPMKFEENELPPLEKNELLDLKKLIPSQHFTQPPPRYSEATLVKTLEKEGIGRPSTYAPILDTIQKRNYVEKDTIKRFKPTKIGTLVNDLLVQHFPEIVDISFTAKMEENLDKVADGKNDWVKTLRDFYNPFEKNLKQKYEEIPKKDLTEKTDKICPKCAGPVIIRWGRFGKFYACRNFPKCKWTENLPKPSLGIKCPKCKKGDVVEKRTRKRRYFYGCNRWPECDFALWDKPTGENCPECGSPLIETKRKQVRCSNKNCSANKSK